jgi:HK97 family phage prohead protease
MTYKSTDVPVLHVRATALSIVESDLPPGVCGRVMGRAVQYDVIDAYGTLFKRGCIDKTRSKVAKGKVKLFVNHGFGDMYGTDSHVGVVRSLETVGQYEEMVADLFDTESGRKQKEYLRAVMESGGETGLSIGFHERGGGWEKVEAREVYSFSEIELEEISLAPRNAVPGSDVTGVRSVSFDSAEMMVRAFARTMSVEQRKALSAVLLSGDEPSEGSEHSTGDDESPEFVSFDDRIKAARRTYSL